MSGANVVRLAPPEKSGAVGYPHRLGRIMLQPGGPNPVQVHVGRTIQPMTAEEAESLARALAQAASDSRRVQL